MIALFASPFVRLAAYGAIILAAMGGIWVHGDHNGAKRIQARWDRAVQAAITQGEKARSDAERDIAPATPDQLRDDKWNRDKR